MKKILQAALMTLAMLGLAHAQEGRGSMDDAQAMVKKAGALIKKEGIEKAAAAFNDPKGEFVKGDLYVVMFKMNGDGIALAHGQNPKVVGKDLSNLRAGDIYPIKEFYKVVNKDGKGWVVYPWPNTITKEIGEKHTYVERFGDVMIGVGAYK